MTSNDKELLIKDLCVRLPYGIKIQYEDNIFEIDYISAMYEEIKLNTPNNYTIDVLEVKPYLFPMSSITEEQIEELEGLCWYFDFYEIYNIDEYGYKGVINQRDCFDLIDWLNVNHFDYKGLIKKGLAIDCTNLNVY